jgi:hypothetical protein
MANMNAGVVFGLIGIIASAVAYLSGEFPPLWCITAFFASVVAALAFAALPASGAGKGAAAKGGKKVIPSKKVVKKAEVKKEQEDDDDEDEDDDEEEEEKEIGLSLDPTNVLPTGSRRQSKVPGKYNDSTIQATLPTKRPSTAPSSSPLKAKGKKSPAKKDSDIFIVDRIVDRRILNGQVLYYVKWKGYAMDQATWEPLKNLDKVMDLVEEFDEAADSQKKAPPSSSKRKSTSRGSAFRSPSPKKAPAPRKSVTKAKATPSKAEASPKKASPAPKRSTRKSTAPKSPAKKESSPKKASPVKTRRSTRGN